MLGARAIEFNRARTGRSDRLRLPGGAQRGAASARVRRRAAVQLHLSTRLRRHPDPPGNGPVTLAIDCDMAGGSSGGGWVNGRGASTGSRATATRATSTTSTGPTSARSPRSCSRADGSAAGLRGPQVTNLGGSGRGRRRGRGRGLFKLKGGDDRVAAAEGDDGLRRRRRRPALGAAGADVCVAAAAATHRRGAGARHLRRRRRARPSPRLREEARIP